MIIITSNISRIACVDPLDNNYGASAVVGLDGIDPEALLLLKTAY